MIEALRDSLRDHYASTGLEDSSQVAQLGDGLHEKRSVPRYSATNTSGQPSTNTSGQPSLEVDLFHPPRSSGACELL